MSEEWGDLTTLRTYGECLADAKKARISAENRAERGGTAHSAAEKDSITGPAKDQEAGYEKRLLDEYQRVVPDRVRAWAAAIPGFGDGALFARIIAAIGHPRIATPYEWGTDEKGRAAAIPAGEPFERTPRQLRQYCGAGDPETNPRQDVIGHSPTREDKLRGGKRTTVRPLLFTFSSYLVRMHTRNEKIAQSHYYQVFQQARKDAESKVHFRQCQNKARPPFAPNGCGTFAHPEWGAPGSPWRPGHMNMHAHRVVHQQFLLDLWEVSGPPCIP